MEITSRRGDWAKVPGLPFFDAKNPHGKWLKIW